jgi:hypothetical protein
MDFPRKGFNPTPDPGRSLAFDGFWSQKNESNCEKEEGAGEGVAAPEECHGIGSDWRTHFALDIPQYDEGRRGVSKEVSAIISRSVHRGSHIGLGEVVPFEEEGLAKGPGNAIGQTIAVVEDTG